MTTIDAKAEELPDYTHPTRECDLVMKGGVTSGIVYPTAILKLAGEGQYRFRNIGGTSAGAIAAAVAAAAEYGREQAGFEKLEQLSATLGQPGFLLRLFQPDPELKPLMYVLLALLDKLPPELKTQLEDRHLPASVTQPVIQRLPILQRLQTFVSAVRLFHPKAANQGAEWGMVIGGTLALILVAIPTLICFMGAQTRGSLFSLWGFLVWFIVLGGLFSAVGYWVGIAISGIVHLSRDLFHQVPQTLFGLCLGHQLEANGTPNPDSTVLTDWLCAQLNDLAGKPKTATPLTFGELYHKPYSPLPNQPHWQPPFHINLKMVTSNLSQSQPYTLPFAEGHGFLFCATEFRQLFPGHVVTYLIEQQGACRYRLPPDFHLLPDPEHLPVIVATRLSLSFPLLVSAVPLYTIRRTAIEQRSMNEPLTLQPSDLQKHWFSDGGICSNFPIHFFDAWLPSRPTFGINLETIAVDQGHPPTVDFNPTIHERHLSPVSVPGDPSSMASRTPSSVPDVYLPAPDAEPLSTWTDLIDQTGRNSLLTFVRQIFQTAQGYRDTTQSYLPGYRERIVQIRLARNEGGLNLAMNPDTIERVMQKGSRAGQLLNDFDFPRHKWVRFRVLMGVLENKLQEVYQAALRPDPQSGSEDVFGTQALIAAAHDPHNPYPFPYPTAAHQRKAAECAERMRESIELCWNEGSSPPSPSLADVAPLPKPVLRTMPDL